MSWLNDLEGIVPRENSETREAHQLESYEFSPMEQEYLRQIQELDDARWCEISINERAEALRELEARLAEVEGRPPVELRVEDLAPGLNGYYDRNLNIMVLSNELLGRSTPQEAIDTVAHEGRHAYQQYCVLNPGFHDDELEVSAWAENFDDYLNASLYGYEEYRNQPVEADAWRYGEMVRQIFEQKGRST